MILQIRRSSYHDVIRVSEIQKYLDMTRVQTYIINSARIVFLNERPQPRHGKGVTNTCEVCERSLLDSFQFYSLGCEIVGTLEGLNKYANKMKVKIKATTLDSEEEESHSSITHGSAKCNVIQSISPASAVPLVAVATMVKSRSARRRKGVPHRHLFGSFIIEY